MKEVAIGHTPVPDIKNVAYDAERWSLLLDRGIEGLTVICSRRRHVHRPAWVDVACVYVKGNDEMFYGFAAIGCGYRVQKQRARRQIDNRGTDDAHGIELSAFEIACRHRRANVALPNNGAVYSIERVHIIRFGYRNDRRPAAWTVVDVKRLRVNVAHDCAVEIQVACQIRCGVEREGGINIETVPRIVIVELGNVDLSASL